MSVSAFTREFDNVPNRLTLDSKITYNGNTIDAKCLWDTGATCTAISTDVVTRLNLIAVGRMTIHTPSGSKDTNVYLVDIALPNNVVIQDVQVCDSEIGAQGIDLLIGMNIISRGDFAVTTSNGRTSFTFRMPSAGRIDFVKNIGLINTMAKKRVSKRNVPSRKR